MATRRKIGYIGDIDYVEYGGGPVFTRGNIRGKSYGPGSPHVEYTDGLEIDAPHWYGFDNPDWEDGRTSGPTLDLYQVEVYDSAAEFLDWYDWIDWEEIARSWGRHASEYTDPDNLRTAEGRAYTLWEAAGYMGWRELDTEGPRSITLRELLERWNEEY